MLESTRQRLYRAIQKALEDAGAPDTRFVLERSGDFTHGDYSTNAALVAAKFLHTNPLELAYKIQDSLVGKCEGVELVSVAGPGFVNFFLTEEAIASEVDALSRGVLGDIRSDMTGQTVMVEYTDPNPFKEFHIGHLMSNAIGESIARLLESTGVKVLRANYQGDVGLHVAKAIWGAQKLNKDRNGSDLNGLTFELGLAYPLGAQAYEVDAEAKKEINEINKQVYEKSNTEVNALYDLGRSLSLARFEELYKILGTTFAYYFYESQTSERGVALVKSHMGDVFEVSDGATIFKGEKVGLHTRVFLNSQGLPTYEAKDLGLLQLKKETTTFGQSISITASEQTEYFKVLLAAAKEIREVADVANKTTHISHGMMRFAEGKMSSRRGNVITGESLLLDLTAAAKEKMQGHDVVDPEKTAEQIAVGAIKYAVLKQKSSKDIIFDPEKALSLHGDSGPYLQYARVRALSIMRTAQEAGIIASQGIGNAATGGFLAPTERILLERTLIHFPAVIQRAATELEPHYLTTYLTELASAFNSWYASERVVDGPNPTYALLLTQAFECTIQQGLTLLGIPSPREM